MRALDPEKGVPGTPPGSSGGTAGLWVSSGRPWRSFGGIWGSGNHGPCGVATQQSWLSCRSNAAIMVRLRCSSAATLVLALLRRRKIWEVLSIYRQTPDQPPQRTLCFEGVVLTHIILAPGARGGGGPNSTSCHHFAGHRGIRGIR